MSTYLQLVRDVCIESGTVPSSSLPATVIGVTGRIADMARWTQKAWVDIQNARNAWRWMRGEWQASTVAGQQRYTVSELGVAARFAEWLHENEAGEAYTTAYNASIGPADEGRLIYMPFSLFYTARLRGTQTQDRPLFYSVDDQQRLALSPVPDAIYTMRGMYRKSPQVLSADSDIPEMPARFHDLIVWWALGLLAANDESMEQLPIWRQRVRELMSDLERDQLPQLSLTMQGLA
jgi:hypothetical protein